MVESNDVAYQLYQSGEIDSASLTESNLNTIYNDESNPYHDYLTEVPADRVLLSDPLQLQQEERRRHTGYQLESGSSK